MDQNNSTLQNPVSHVHSEQQFREIMINAGLTPPDYIKVGVINRFPGVGKKKGKDGWCRLFNDLKGGIYGCYSTDLEEIWKLDHANNKINQPVDRDAVNKRVAARKADEEKKQSDAALRAQDIWCNSLPATEHQYLKNKQVKPYGIKVSHGNLVISIHVNDVMTSLQFIKPDGNKMFMGGGKIKGGIFYIGDEELTETICIGTGFATCASIHEATGFLTVVTFNDGNLQAGAQAVAKQYPNSILVICSDDDWKKDTNTAITKAKVAAELVGGVVALPTFDSHRPDWATDFNDLDLLEGGTEVKRQIDAAVSVPEKIEFGEIEKLPSLLTPVKECSGDLFPDNLRLYINDVSERMQCPIDYLYAGTLTALSGAVGSRSSIKPKQEDDWTVIPNLWGYIVGRPGMMKSPALEEIMSALKKKESVNLENYLREKEVYRKKEFIHKIHMEKMKSEIKKLPEKEAIKLLDDNPPPEKPIHTRVILKDPTVEALTEVLVDNNQGVLVYRDELTGFLTSLNKEGREDSRSFYLEGWNGNGSFSSDRIGRGHTHVETVCISMLGSIQPSRLFPFIHAAITGRESDDGLIQRFQVVVYPDVNKAWVNVDRLPNDKAKANFDAVFDRLIKMSSESTSRRFDKDAQFIFNDWRTNLEFQLRSGELHPALESHFSKYRKLFPSIALLLALADDVKGDIPVKYAEKAKAWCEYLASHSNRIYNAGIGSQVDAAKAIARRIKKKDLEDGFTSREVYRRHWVGLSDQSLVLDGIQVLVDHHWLKPKLAEKLSNRGLQKTIYSINPNAYECEV